MNNAKMLIVLNYKDGEICVTFDEIRAAMDKKENPDNIDGYQGSSLKSVGDPSGNLIEDLPFGVVWQFAIIAGFMRHFDNISLLIYHCFK